MKKKTLGLLGICLLASAGLGMCTGMCIKDSYKNQIAVVYAESEQAAENIENASTQEEIDEWKKLYEQAMAKFNEIKNKQIAGTTIGAIVGAVVGALVSMMPALLNRANIHKAIETVAITRSVADNGKKIAEDVKEKFNITDKKLDKSIEIMDNLSKSLEIAVKKLEIISSENAEIKEENKELKELFMLVFSSSTVLTSLGISEEAFKKYLPKK